MSRYIEIVFDDSGSMKANINGRPKHILAKEMFNDMVLPQLGKRGDELVLRTLRKGCEGISKIKSFAYKGQLKKSINSIDDFYNNTPLYLTIRDSIQACSKTEKTEKIIFVLTDGDDNCSQPLDKILSEEELKQKEQIKTEIILIQFAVNSKISQNNLTALSQKLKASNVIIGQNEISDTKKIKTRINKAFVNSGIDADSKLDYCFDELDDNEYLHDTWDLMEFVEGIDFYLAELLYQEKLLSWKPKRNNSISKTQFVELDFLYTLRFRNSLPESLVKQMLSQLKKPYLYSHDCIYWDFKLRRWRYHERTSNLNILDNPDAENDDLLPIKKVSEEDFHKKESEIFDGFELYEVKAGRTESPTFKLVKSHQKTTIIIQPVKELNQGDIVEFKFK